MMGPIEAIKNVYWHRLFTCEGRSSRAEFWWAALFGSIIGVIVEMISESFIKGDSATDLLFLLVLLPIIFFLICGGICVSIRRLHDIGSSGFWILLNLLPFVGSIILLIMHSIRSQPIENKWGSPPITLKS